MRVSNKVVLPILLLAMISLLSAIWAGLSRIGWHIPVPSTGLALYHGPLMTIGFLGSLISLERAVALRKKWMFAAPVFLGAAGLVLVAGISSLSGKYLLTLGSLFFVFIHVTIIRTHNALYSWIMLAGSLSVLLGNILWVAGLPIHRVVWWWALFLVFMIAGERLELSRIIQLPLTAKIIFSFLCLAAGVGLVSTAMLISAGYPLIGFSLLGLGVWFLRYDIARRAIRKSGRTYLPVTRYIAYALLIGFIWLALSGLMLLLFGFPPAGLIYDSILHMLFIGFVFSMIFGHAPIILPSIFGININFSPMLYVPLALLHLSLALRLLGDLSRQANLRLWGGLLNGVAILLFMGMILAVILRSKNNLERTS